ncbi:adenine phosphoribosyltransferase [Chlorobium phaeovibrioides]|uniref:Adenine phosphoribosyltransferase n=1 Tax=Chlorobium phaeovibrioides TaxID=1094 RepID=A0A3S0NB56_CHLPH|nr:adenine phosphoribosyltransferase [Chlorobium phaeovibrioides]QEQ56497.1 adenine phosphoribosyltransferase [Chlorobium phaeovibrioides]RTY39089.1 adenine phosphoribosyltransferase [Chlorobium phaeovibrioides]
MPIKSRIRAIPDYPKKGIMFRDITTLIKDPVGFRLVIDGLTQRYLENGVDFDVVVGVEARGFIPGSALAYTLGKGFVPVRKPGKLPADVVSQEYELEYGTDKVEIHLDAILPGTRVLLVDDLLATGGTALAAAALVEKVGGVVAEMAFIVNLPDIGGERKILDKGYRVFSLTEFEGE